MNTKELIKKLIEKYPDSQIQDICKALCQSTMGSGHFIEDISSCAERIQSEYKNMKNNEDDSILDLGEEYVRAPVSFLKKGLSSDSLAKMFALSVAKDNYGVLRLEKDLDEFILLCKEENCFPSEEVKKFIFEWKQQGYPSLHHSEIYRKTYSPAYRLVRKDMLPWLPAVIRIDQLRKEKKKITVAIDGHCGSGKTTCGVFLHKLYDSNLIHVDDFYLQKHQRTKQRYAQPGGNFDRERLEEEVLIPCRQNKDINYHWFDCYTLTLQDMIHLPAKEITVIEGSYSMYPSLRSYYDLSIFIDIDPAKQLQRITKRNPDNYQDFVEKWIPFENMYFDADNVKEACDIVICT